MYSNPTQQPLRHSQPFLLVSVIGEDKIFVSTFPAKPSKGTVRNCTLKPPSCDLIFVSLETLLTNLGWCPTGTDTGTGGSLYPAYITLHCTTDTVLPCSCNLLQLITTFSSSCLLPLLLDTKQTAVGAAGPESEIELRGISSFVTNCAASGGHRGWPRVARRAWRPC